MKRNIKYLIIDILIFSLGLFMALNYFMTTKLRALPIVYSIIAFIAFVETIHDLIKIYKRKAMEKQAKILQKAGDK